MFVCLFVCDVVPPCRQIITIYHEPIVFGVDDVTNDVIRSKSRSNHITKLGNAALIWDIILG